MRLVVHSAQPGDGDMGVELGGGQRGVAEQLLNDPQIGTAFEQVCRGTVPQPVWPDVGRTRDRGHGLVHDCARLPGVQPGTARTQEQRRSRT